MSLFRLLGLNELFPVGADREEKPEDVHEVSLVAVDRDDAPVLFSSKDVQGLPLLNQHLVRHVDLAPKNNIGRWK